MKVHTINWWPEKSLQNWFARFITARNIKLRKPVCIGSVFGPRTNYLKLKNHNIIFFSGENLETGRFSEYHSYLLQEADLSLGFGSIRDCRYLRFPLWLTHIIKPENTEAQTLNAIAKLRFPLRHAMSVPRFKSISLIASHDLSGIRTKMYSDLSSVARVSCPGLFMRNSYALKTVFRDNKIAYLRLFKFNACPENSDSNGYVTEKLFDAIISGCIPIYCGSNNMPEPLVINADAIVFYDPSSAAMSLCKVNSLMQSTTLMNEFRNLPRLLPTAEENIISYLDSLEEKLRTCLV